MSEPIAHASSPPPGEGRTPEQALAAIASIRGNPNHDWAHEGRPGHGAAMEEMRALYGEAYPDPSRSPNPDSPPQSDLHRKLTERYRGQPEMSDPLPLPTGDPPAAPEAKTQLELDRETAKRYGLPDPSEGPQNAADLNAYPLPEFSEPAQAAGLTWDRPALGELFTTAEREAIVPLVPQGLTLVAALAGQPMPTGEETEWVLEDRWGSQYDHKIMRATEAWKLLPKKIQADLTRTGIRYHPDFVEYLLRIGERRWDPATPAGFRRVRQKYTKAAQDAARDRDAWR